MNTFRKVLIGLIVALAVIIPLTFAATATSSPTTQRAIIRIADGPTPTNTPNTSGGNSGGCHGGGC